MDLPSNLQNWNQLWDAYAESARINPAQEYRRKRIFSLLDLDSWLDSAKGPIRLLDIGSGQGDFSLEVKNRYPRAEILGLELSQSGVAIAKRKVPQGEFLPRDLTLALADDPPSAYRNWATHAVCSELLEHVDEPERILENIKPFLSSGCRLILTVPGGPMSYFDRHIGHRRHFSLKAFGQILDKGGFALDRAERAGFPFMNLYRLVVIARGKRLVTDVSGESERALSLTARAVMGAFRWLFHLNLPDFPLGWQLIGVAHKRDG